MVTEFITTKKSFHLQPTTYIPTIKKTFVCKTRQINSLKNTFKKRIEKIWKQEKDGYFCTRIDGDVLNKKV